MSIQTSQDKTIHQKKLLFLQHRSISALRDLSDSSASEASSLSGDDDETWQNEKFDPIYLDVPHEEPIFKVGLSVRQNRGPVFVGFCGRNGYFSQPVFNELIPHLLQNHCTVYGYAPNIKFTYEGLGYNSPEAVRRALKDQRALYRRAKRAASRHITSTLDKSTACGCGVQGYEEKNKEQGYKQIATDIEEQEIFRSALTETMELFNQNSELRKMVEETTSEVLQTTRLKSTITLQEGIQVGVQFVLRELAMIWRVHSILGLDPNTDIGFVYHKKTVPLFQHFMSGDYFPDAEPLPHVGYIALVMEKQ